MSDTTFCSFSHPTQEPAFFQLHAVFDGHGGSSVSEFAKQHIPHNLKDILRANLDATALFALARQTHGCEEVAAGIETCVAQAVVETNAQLQSEDRQQKLYQWMGSTAVLCLMWEQHVWIANAGKLSHRHTHE